MPKPQFQNLTFECWRHLRRLGQTPTSLCFYQADVRACEPLLAALDGLAAATPPPQIVLTLRPSERPKPINTLRLRLTAESDDLRVMCIEHGAGVATIDLTPRGLPALRQAIETWHGGREDFGIGSGDNVPRKELGPRDKASSEAWFWGPGYYAP
jgi:hypothetical protein